jgi:hypothetical protein
VPVVPADAEPLVAGVTEHFEDLTGSLGLADVVTGDDDEVAALGLVSGVR